MIDDSQLAQRLVELNVANREQIEHAQRYQRSHQLRSLYEALIYSALVEEDAVVRAASELARVPHMLLDDYEFNPNVVQLFSSSLALRQRILPLELREDFAGQQLVLAMEDPLDLDALDEVERRMSLEVEPMLVGPLALGRALQQLYGVTFEPKAPPIGAPAAAPAKPAPAPTPKPAPVPQPKPMVAGAEASEDSWAGFLDDAFTGGGKKEEPVAKRTMALDMLDVIEIEELEETIAASQQAPPPRPPPLRKDAEEPGAPEAEHRSSIVSMDSWDLEPVAAPEAAALVRDEADPEPPAKPESFGGFSFEDSDPLDFSPSKPAPEEPPSLDQPGGFSSANDPFNFGDESLGFEPGQDVDRSGDRFPGFDLPDAGFGELPDAGFGEPAPAPAPAKQPERATGFSLFGDEDEDAPPPAAKPKGDAAGFSLFDEDEAPAQAAPEAPRPKTFSLLDDDEDDAASARPSAGDFALQDPPSHQHDEPLSLEDSWNLDASGPLNFVNKPNTLVFDAEAHGELPSESAGDSAGASGDNWAAIGHQYIAQNKKKTQESEIFEEIFEELDQQRRLRESAEQDAVERESMSLDQSGDLSQLRSRLDNDEVDDLDASLEELPLPNLEAASRSIEAILQEKASEEEAANRSIEALLQEEGFDLGFDDSLPPPAAPANPFDALDEESEEDIFGGLAAPSVPATLSAPSIPAALAAPEPALPSAPSLASLPSTPRAPEPTPEPEPEEEEKPALAGALGRLKLKRIAVPTNPTGLPEIVERRRDLSAEDDEDEAPESVPTEALAAPIPPPSSVALDPSPAPVLSKPTPAPRLDDEPSEPSERTSILGSLTSPEPSERTSILGSIAAHAPKPKPSAPAADEPFELFDEIEEPAPDADPLAALSDAALTRALARVLLDRKIITLDELLAAAK